MPSKRRTLLAGASLCAALVLNPACSSGPKRDAASFCPSYVSAARHGAAISDPDNVSVASLKRQVDDIDTEAKTAVRHAPDVIAPDARAVIAPLHALRDALQRSQTRADAKAALRVYLAAGKKLRVHQQRLDGWVAANCHVVPVTTAPTTTLTGTVGSTG
jgi:hypothetical protein